MLLIESQNLNILLLKFRQQMEEHILLLKRRGGALEEGIFIILDFVRLYQVRWCWYYQHHLQRKGSNVLKQSFVIKLVNQI